MTDLNARITPGRNRSTGNAIVEYAMPGVAMLCICMAGFAAVGVNFKQVMHFLGIEMSQQISNTEAQKILHDQERDRFVMLQNLTPSHQFLGDKAYSVNQSSSDPNSLCSGDWCVNAPGLTGNIVNTAGTNGQVASLTGSAANIFTQVAQKIKEEGGDPSLVTLLTNLANQGHSIGNAEGGLDSQSDYNSFSNNINTIQSGRENFNNLTNQLNSVIMQLPEESRGLVTDAATVISTIAYNYTFSGSSGGEMGYHYTSSSAQLTHSGANTICSQGGDTSKCIH